MAYDGEPIGDDPIAQKIFNLASDAEVPLLARRVVGAVVGGGGGKSYVLVALRLIWGALTRDLSMSAPGEVVVSLVMAPSLKLARQAINYIRGALETKPELRALMMTDGADKLCVPILLPNGKRVNFEAFAAGAKGTGARSRRLADAVLDECCFFGNEEDGFVVNDTQAYQAAIARVLPGGQVILPSTPWTEGGLLWEVYDANYGKPKTALVAQASTLELNPSKWAEELVEIETLRDPENARREFGAQFVTAGVGTYFDGNAIKQACKVYSLPKPRELRFKYAAAADFAFKSDSSALVIVEYDGVTYRQVEELEVKPEPDKPLKPSEVVNLFAERIKAYGLTTLIADGHYFEAVREHLMASKIALTEAPPGTHGKLDSHNRAKAVLHEGKCEFSDDSLLPDQLKQVLKRPNPGGGMTIYVKRKPGRGHGDIASAWVLAVNQLAMSKVNDAEEPEPPRHTHAWQVWKFKKDDAKWVKAETRKLKKLGKLWT